MPADLMQVTHERPVDAIKRLWQQMSKYVEPRDGRPGIDFSSVTVLAP